MLRDQRNHHHHHYYYYHYHHLSVKGAEQKIEPTCAVDTYDAKSKLPIELNILHSVVPETNNKTRTRLKTIRIA